MCSVICTEKSLFTKRTQRKQAHSSLVDSNSVPGTAVSGERALKIGDFTGAALRGALRNELIEALLVGGGVG